ncbi:NTP transferase domain-containing protein [Microbacterium sp. NPDC019599]|uniref:nucleotidyltransferase family protein n=1 Tax=Microbacterium sp. NPDC019599 TaxID=3154690 RepID=UPI00340C18F9
MSEAAPVASGLVLAAGAGTRFGGPKALARLPDGTPWVARAVQALTDADCRRVVVALGAAAVEARLLVPEDAEIVEVPDWAEGLSATLRSGLRAASIEGTDAVAIVPVDTPAMPAAAVRRVLAAGTGGRAAVVQAVYRGVPGHPVLIGADHVEPLLATLSGDRGARAYLVAQGALEVECADLWSGADIDTR